MTTDPLLARIEAEIKKIETWLEEGDIVWTSQEQIDEANQSLRPWQALLFVVERHGNDYLDGHGNPACGSCIHYVEEDGEDIARYVTFPCDEYKGIAEIMGVTP